MSIYKYMNILQCNWCFSISAVQLHDGIYEIYISKDSRILYKANEMNIVWFVESNCKKVHIKTLYSCSINCTDMNMNLIFKTNLYVCMNSVFIVA